MTERNCSSYKTFSLTDFIEQYEETMPEARLFELTLPWLNATAEFMAPNNSQVIVHCLFTKAGEKDSALLIAWPLVHQESYKGFLKPQISSLTSFYSAIAEPIFFTSATQSKVKDLLYFITKENPWSSLKIGGLEEGTIALSAVKSLSHSRLYSYMDNIFQTQITDFEDYYQQRPSQLRNTIRRREKKLAKGHEYRIDIITEQDKFCRAFDDYQQIYQKSWKGDEFSFEFIEQVCQVALKEDKLRLGVMYIDEIPVAAQIWFLQLYSQGADGNYLNINDLGSSDEVVKHKSVSIFKLAYVPDYQKYSVGSILSLALSEYVISKDKVSTIEFGMGSEPYKKDWLCESRMRFIYQVFNPRGIYGKLILIYKIIIPRVIKFLTGKATS